MASENRWLFDLDGNWQKNAKAGKYTNFEITTIEYCNTGGGCMVLFAKVWLADETRFVYASTNGESTSIYNTKEDMWDAYAETEISYRWYEDNTTTDNWDNVHASLLKKFAIENARHIVRDRVGKALCELDDIAENESDEEVAEILWSAIRELGNILHETPRD